MAGTILEGDRKQCKETIQNKICIRRIHHIQEVTPGPERSEEAGQQPESGGHPERPQDSGKAQASIIKATERKWRGQELKSLSNTFMTVALDERKKPHGQHVEGGDRDRD